MDRNFYPDNVILKEINIIKPYFQNKISSYKSKQLNNQENKKQQNKIKLLLNKNSLKQKHLAKIKCQERKNFNLIKPQKSPKNI